MPARLDVHDDHSKGGSRMARRGVMLSIGVAASVAAIAIGAFGIANAMGTPPGPEIISETPLIAPAATPEPTPGPTITETPPADPPTGPGGSGSPGSGDSEQTNPPTQPVAPPPIVVDDDDDDDDDEYDDEDDEDEYDDD